MLATRAQCQLLTAPARAWHPLRARCGGRPVPRLQRPAPPPHRTARLLHTRALRPPPRLAHTQPCRAMPLSTSAPAPATAPPSGEGEADGGPVLVYEGPLTFAVRSLKMVSVTTCSLTAVSMPLALVYGNPETPLGAKLALIGTTFTLGLGTTAVLHYFSRRYVSRVLLAPAAADRLHQEALALDDLDDFGDADAAGDAAEDEEATEADEEPESFDVVLETINFLGRTKTLSVPTSELVFPGTGPSVAPFVSFTHGSRSFFIHAELVQDHPIMARVFAGLFR